MPTPPAEAEAPTANSKARIEIDGLVHVERIERRLQTKVTLHPTAKGGGKLELNFFNLEDLERIGGLLLGEIS